jgi:serine O-acetyltransferase
VGINASKKKCLSNEKQMNNEFIKNISNFKTQYCNASAENDDVNHFINLLFDTLFLCTSPEHKNEFYLEQSLLSVDRNLLHILNVINEGADNNVLINNFKNQLPQIYNLLTADAQAMLAADPAAKNLQEIIVAYPGFKAIFMHRIAHQLLLLNIPLLPRVISEIAHSLTGIDIHPGAQIGQSFVIDHGTGIVIGETAVIGNHVKIFQGVTLGALNVVKENASKKRHPTIEDNVVIYGNATILGGNTIIGHDSVIGGNSWITKSVTPFSVAYIQPTVTVQDKKTFNQPIDFFI